MYKRNDSSSGIIILTKLFKNNECKQTKKSTKTIKIKASKQIWEN